MKIFIQDNKLNPMVKIIKEEKISRNCWNVIVHTFELKNKTVFHSLDKYNEISDETEMSLTHPVDYVLRGHYYETPCRDLKYLQAEYVGTRVLISIACQQDINRDELIRTSASTKPSVDTIYSLVRCYGWSLQRIDGKVFTNYEPTTECSKKVEVKTDSKPKEAATLYIKLVDHVLYDEEKRIVIVFFVDGTKIVKKCHSEDKFDIYIGVSLAITKYLFGNNTTNFIKFVDRKKKKALSKKERETKIK